MALFRSKRSTKERVSDQDIVMESEQEWVKEKVLTQEDGTEGELQERSKIPDSPSGEGDDVFDYVAMASDEAVCRGGERDFVKQDRGG